MQQKLFEQGTCLWTLLDGAAISAAVFAVWEVVQQNHFQNLGYRWPVVDEIRVVGVVSPRDFFKSVLAAVLGYGEMAQKKLLNTLRVKDAMSEPAIVISPEATIKEAVQLM
jgi:CBS-domain-containing membrane protein